MRTVQYTAANGAIETAIIVNRIDQNMFACKSNSRKRSADLIVHLDYILTDVSDITFEAPKFSDEKDGYFATDEFAGLCQAGALGLNPFKCTIMCSNPELNEVTN